jgi:peptidoglycan/LPS O-acetylase OafA/YrhL
VRNLIAVVSFIMAVIGGLAAMLSAHRDRQTMATIVAAAFLISFFINVSKEAKLVLQGACLISFAMAVLGGGVAIFTNQNEKRTGGIITGIVALGTSLAILFLYLEIYAP